jgi:hypothetical protein
MSKMSLLGFDFQHSLRVLVCVMSGGCTVISHNAPDGGTPDSAVPGDGGSFAFAPSNLSLAGIDVSTVVDVDMASDCFLDTGPTPGSMSGAAAVNPR